LGQIKLGGDGCNKESDYLGLALCFFRSSWKHHPCGNQQHNGPHSHHQAKRCKH
jgi:hypothetical protein